MDAQPFSGAGLVGDTWIKTNPQYIPSASAVSSRDGLDTFYGQGYKQTNTNVLNMDLVYKLKLDFLTPGLDFKIKGSYNSTYYQVKDRTNDKPAQFMPVLESNGNIALQRSGDYWNPGYTESSWPERDWYAEAAINYNRQFGDHGVTGLVLYNQSKSYYPWDSAGSTYVSIPKGYVGLVGRVTYNYKYKYLFDVNVGISVEVTPSSLAFLMILSSTSVKFDT